MESTEVNLVERLTARIILINEYSELLLLKYVDKCPADPSRPTLLEYWVPPGGGLEQGESFEQAATRELDEEIGVTPPIGPWVWTRKRNLTIGGCVRSVTERYFVTTLDAGRITPLNRANDNFISHKWWTVDQMRGTSETILPPDLSGLIVPILNGQIPEVPIDIDVV